MEVQVVGEGRRPVRSSLLVGDMAEPESLKIAGSRCRECGEATLGMNSLCPNCGSATVEPLAFAQDGVVWTFTVVRYKPPGDYRGPDPFVPFALGLVELPEGLRILAPIGGPVDAVRIGMLVRFRPIVRDDDVVQFNYVPL
jgi:uncharacterized OB-fold protein